MHILFVSTMNANPWGGSEELWAEAATEGLERGHQVSALLPFWPVPHPRVEQLRQAGVNLSHWTEPGVHPEVNRQLGRAHWYPYQSLVDARPDVVCVSHGGFLDIVNGHIPLVALLLDLQIPYAVIIQANTDLYFPDDEQREILRVYLSNARVVYFVSEQNKSIAERQLATALPNAKVSPNPVNLSDHSHLPWPSETRPRFASIARLDAWSKGHDILFAALATNEWKHRDWMLDIYGNGPHERYYQDLIRHFNLAEKVALRGSTSDIRSIWASHHIILLPSRVEGTPLVLMEAMLCGRPAVVTNVGGNADWVSAGVNGWVAPASTVPLFRQALEQCWQDRSQWEKFGKAGRDRFLHQHPIHPGKQLQRDLVALAPSAPSSNSTFAQPSMPSTQPVQPFAIGLLEPHTQTLPNETSPTTKAHACPVTGKPGTLRRTFSAAQLASAYSSYFGTGLPTHIVNKYFRNTIEEYESLESGIRWYEGGDVGEADFYQALGATYSWYYRDESWDKDLSCEILRAIGSQQFVEFGSGNGALLKQAARLGLSGWGVDITEETIEDCRKAGLQMFHFDRIPNPAPAADTLVLLQTIEHVHDPVNFLQNILDKARCEYVILSGPSFEALLGHTRDPLSWPPHHQTAWSERGFASLAEQIGFELVKSFSEPLQLDRLEGMLSMEGSRTMFDLPTFPAGQALVGWMQNAQTQGHKWALYSHSILGLLRRKPSA